MSKSSNPVTGEVYFDSNTYEAKIWTGSQWMTFASDSTYRKNELPTEGLILFRLISDQGVSQSGIAVHDF